MLKSKHVYLFYFLNKYILQDLLLNRFQNNRQVHQKIKTLLLYAAQEVLVEVFRIRQLIEKKTLWKFLRNKWEKYENELIALWYDRKLYLHPNHVTKEFKIRIPNNLNRSKPEHNQTDKYQKFSKGFLHVKKIYIKSKKGKKKSLKSWQYKNFIHGKKA